MIYNSEPKRQEIQKLNPWLFEGNSRVLSFINLCIFPHKWELIYANLRSGGKITKTDYEATKGVICGLMVLAKRGHKDKLISVDAYIIDFIKLVQSDKQNDCIKFLLNMRLYMPRFLFVSGLKASFGLDWRDLVYQALELDKRPQCKTYHSLFTNIHLRTLLYAYIVWKQYRESQDPDYQEGENDLLTLLDKYGTMKKSLGRLPTQKLFETLQLTLPSYSVDARAKAAWAIDTAADGFYQVNRQFSDWRYKQVQG